MNPEVKLALDNLSQECKKLLEGVGAPLRPGEQGATQNALQALNTVAQTVRVIDLRVDGQKMWNSVFGWPGHQIKTDVAIGTIKVGAPAFNFGISSQGRGYSSINAIGLRNEYFGPGLRREATMLHELLHSVFDKGIDVDHSHRGIAEALGIKGPFSTDQEWSEALTKLIGEKCYK